MKFLQIKFREKQSEWLAKRGINWHICSVVARKGEKLEVSSYAYLFNSCSQDWFTVLSILENLMSHVFTILVKHDKALARRKRYKTTWDAGKQKDYKTATKQVNYIHRTLHFMPFKTKPLLPKQTFLNGFFCNKKARVTSCLELGLPVSLRNRKRKQTLGEGEFTPVKMLPDLNFLNIKWTLQCFQSKCTPFSFSRDRLKKSARGCVTQFVNASSKTRRSVYTLRRDADLCIGQLKPRPPSPGT